MEAQRSLQRVMIASPKGMYEIDQDDGYIYVKFEGEEIFNSKEKVNALLKIKE